MANVIRDRQGTVVGYEDRDGTLRDRNNRKVGSYNRRTGTVHNNEGEEIGFVDSAGTVVDRYRRRVGSLANDGTVQDWHGIPVFTGSAAPLLLDFEKGGKDEPPVKELNFDKAAREARADPTRAALRALKPEGYVSPSLVGCLALIGAVLIGTFLLFLLQNPSVFNRAAASPTARAVANATSLPQANGTPAAGPALSATSAPQTGKVNTQILNLRKGPGTNFDIVDRLQQDEQVVIVGRLQDGIWLKITVPAISKDGWVAAEYINADGDTSTLPVVEK